LKYHLARRFDGQRDKVNAQVRKLAERIERGAEHLELGLDLQSRTLAHAFDNVKAAAWHPKVHVLSITDLDMKPVNTCVFQVFDLRTQDRVIRPVQSGGDLCFLSNSADCVAHTIIASFLHSAADSYS